MPSQINPNQFEDAQPVSKSALRDTLSTVKGELEHGGFVRIAAEVPERRVSEKLGDSPNVKDFGARGDGASDDTAAIVAADLSANGRTLFFPPGTYVIKSATLNANLALAQGARLDVPAGKTLALNGEILAGRYQIFSGGARSPADKPDSWDSPVVATPRVNRLYPEWWLDPADATHQRAFVSMKFFARRYWSKTFPITVDLDAATSYAILQDQHQVLSGWPNLVFEGNGAWMNDSGTFSSIFFGDDSTSGIGRFYFGAAPRPDKDDYLIESIQSGSDQITLKIAAKAAEFEIGQHLLLTGFSQMGYGYPPNPHFLEYAVVKDIDAGVLTVVAPIRNSYFDDWPEEAGNDVDWGRARAIPCNNMGRVSVRNMQIADNKNIYLAYKEYGEALNVIADSNFFVTHGILFYLAGVESRGHQFDGDKLVGSIVCERCDFNRVVFHSGVNELILRDTKITTGLSVQTRKLICENVDFGFWAGGNSKFFAEYAEWRNCSGGDFPVLNNSYVNNTKYQTLAGEWMNGVLRVPLATAAFTSLRYKSPPGGYIAEVGHRSNPGRIVRHYQDGDDVVIEIVFPEPLTSATPELYPYGYGRMELANFAARLTTPSGSAVRRPDYGYVLASGSFDVNTGQQEGLLRYKMDDAKGVFMFEGGAAAGYLQLPPKELAAIEVDVIRPDTSASGTVQVICRALNGGNLSTDMATVLLKTAGRRKFFVDAAATGLQTGDTDNMAALVNLRLHENYIAFTNNAPGKAVGERAIFSITYLMR